MDNQITLDSIHNIIGRLYLNSQRDLDRLQAAYEVQLKQLDGQLKAEQNKRLELEKILKEHELSK